VGSRGDRLRKRKPRPRPRSATWTVRYAIGALIAVVAVALVLGVALRRESRLALGIGGLLLDAFILVTLLPLYHQKRLRLRDLGLRPTAPGKAIGLVALAVVAVAATNALWLQGVLGEPIQSLGVSLHVSTIDKIVIGVQLCLTAPVVEEIFFRGLLYRTLRNRMSVVSAALIAGLLFGAIHGMAYPLNSLPPRMVFGMIACLLYERTGSLYPSMALHGLIDGSAFVAAIGGQAGIVYLAYAGLAVSVLAYAGHRHRDHDPPLRTPQPAPTPPSRAGPKGPAVAD
jgi:membrane protease YdiL (CAAX protease family)